MLAMEILIILTESNETSHGLATSRTTENGNL